MASERAVGRGLRIGRDEDRIKGDRAAVPSDAKTAAPSAEPGRASASGPMEIEMPSSTVSTPRASLPAPTSAAIGERSANPVLSRSIPEDGIRDPSWFRRDPQRNPRNPDLDRERDQIRAATLASQDASVSSRSDQYVSLRPGNGIRGIRDPNCACRQNFSAPEGPGLAGGESRRSGQQGRSRS